MVRTVKTMKCDYITRGDKEVKSKVVIANNEQEATTALSKMHGKKGCAFILGYEEHTVKYEMADEIFLANAKVVEIDGKPVE